MLRVALVLLQVLQAEGLEFGGENHATAFAHRPRHLLRLVPDTVKLFRECRRQLALGHRIPLHPIRARPE